METGPIEVTNSVHLEFPSLPDNVGFARAAIAFFASRLDFTLDELEEIKVAVSEAVSNVVVHAYPDGPG
ncbi:MAG TPA: ATP-binding protein, partial [Limnochorda sp.]